MTKPKEMPTGTDAADMADENLKNGDNPSGEAPGQTDENDLEPAVDEAQGGPEDPDNADTEEEADTAEDPGSKETEGAEGKNSGAAGEEFGEEDEELQARYMRLMADFQNYKKRTEKERSEVYRRANEGLVIQLLEVMDNFERAISNDTGGDGFKDGMQMIFDQLKDVLAKTGVEEIEADGADFDPNFHNAVMMEDTDRVESGKICEVLQKGYTLNGRVIRPAMVKVAN